MLKWFRYILLILASVFSFYAVRPEPAEVHGRPSSVLTQVTHREEGIIRVDYVDFFGKLTYASDRHYATFIRHLDDDGRVILGEMFDENGETAKQPAGYCAIGHVYNALGQETETEYFDGNGELVQITSGYAVLVRTYNENSQADTDLYFDGNGSPVNCTSGYHGYKRVYDENRRVAEIWYLGKDGNLVNGRSGYAVSRRFYHDTGKIAREFYLDVDLQPAQGALGQYGYANMYNAKGQVCQVTYLDPDGRPMKIHGGYAMVQRTYDAAGKLYEEHYLDTQGNPVPLIRGQYGVRHVDGKNILLDKDGNEIFDLHNYLYNAPFHVIWLGMILVVMAVVLPRRICAGMLAVYILFICYMTLMFREAGDARMNLELFWSYRQLAYNASLRAEVVNNIWLFIPAGAMIYRLSGRWRSVLLAALFSACIEAAQYVFGLGLCELDDLFGNTLGACTGFAAAWQLRQTYELIVAKARIVLERGKYIKKAKSVLQA